MALIAGTTLAWSANDEPPASNHKNYIRNFSYKVSPNYNNLKNSGKISLFGNYPEGDCQFKVLDSLANAYSYFSNDQMPFVYHAGTNTLVTIMRGYEDLARNPGGSKVDCKDNLFIHISTDQGTAWSNKMLIYNYNVHQPKQRARYPSVTATYDGQDMYYFFCAPVPNDASGKWDVGTINGFTPGTGGPFASLSAQGLTYTWSSDNRMASFFSTNPYAFAVGHLWDNSSAPSVDNQNTGIRSVSSDLQTWTTSIPDQWASSLFTDPNVFGSANFITTMSLVNFRYDSKNNLFLCVNGLFANESPYRYTSGISKSTDKGKTWTDFDVIPRSVLEDYATSIGITDSVTKVYLSCQDFVNFDNGDNSVIGWFDENRDPDYKSLDQQAFQLLEFFKSATDASWSVRKITDLKRGWVTYMQSASSTTPDTNNQMQYEIQASRTADGKYIVAKWVSFANANADNTDIFISIRSAGSTKWSKMGNITNSPIYDRITWLPDILPNDITAIPIIKVESRPVAGETGQDAIDRQLGLADNYQYVMAGKFNAQKFLAVGDDPVLSNESRILSISPNPTSDGFANVNFIGTDNGFCSIDIYDLFGKKVKNIFNGQFDSNIKSTKFTTSDLSNGVYIARMTGAGSTSSIKFNVIK